MAIRVHALGHVGGEPESRNVQVNGEKRTVVNFSLASRRTKEKTDWIDCTAWGKTAELVENHVKKGSHINVHGILEEQKYDDKDGNKRRKHVVIVHEIEFAGGKDDDEKKSSNKSSSSSSSSKNKGDQEDIDTIFNDDDEIPF